MSSKLKNRNIIVPILLSLVSTMYSGACVVSVAPKNISLFFAFMVPTVLFLAFLLYIFIKAHSDQIITSILCCLLPFSISIRTIFASDQIQNANLNVEHGFSSILNNLFFGLNFAPIRLAIIFLLSIAGAFFLFKIVSQEHHLDKWMQKNNMKKIVLITTVFLFLSCIIFVLAKIVKNIFFSEAAKILLPIFIAFLLSERAKQNDYDSQNNQTSRLFLLCISISIITYLVGYLLIRETGNMVIALISSILLVLLFSSERKIVIPFFAIIIFLFVAFLLIICLIPKKNEPGIPDEAATLAGKISFIENAVLRVREMLIDRLLSYLSPETMPSGKQLIQGFQAISLGGFWGDTTIAFTIPYANNDMVLNFIALRFGLFAVLLILISFFLIFCRNLIIAKRFEETNRFQSYVLYVIALLPTIQLCIQALGNLGLFVFTGVGCPFLSNGDSLFVFTLALMLFSVLSSSLQYERRTKVL